MTVDSEICEVDSLTLPKRNVVTDLNKKALLRQIFMSVMCISGPLIAGACYSQPSITIDQLTDPDEPVFLTKDQASWYAAFHTITAPLGGLIVILLMDKIGRKTTLIVGGVCAAISTIIMALAPETSNESLFIQLLVSRFFIGITCGVGTAPSGAYIGEISNPKIRGRLVLLTSVSIATGITLMYVLGYYIRDDWRLISWISFGYTIFTIIITFIMKESPSWLMSKGRETESLESLKYFRGARHNDKLLEEQIENEFYALKQSCQKVKGVKKPSFMKLVKEREAYKPLLILVMFFAFQQFSGVFVVIVYAVQISVEAGVTIDPILCAIFIGLARLITTILMSPFIDKLGRRPLAFCSGFGMAICMFTLASNTWFPETMSEIPLLPVVCINGFIVASTLGLMTLPFAMTAELFPQKIKGPATGIVLSSGVLMCFINIKLYTIMVASWGKENMFAFYGAISLLSIVCCYMFLPETKGKTLQEIEEHFKFGKSGNPKEIEMKEKENLFK
ncbi:hypothetical protein ACFFRR_000196 [Megaselia abdita]